MKNFWLAIRDASHHTPTLALATICSIGIALLWGSNIGALYPVVDMTLKGESIQKSFEKSLDQAKVRVVELEQRLAKRKLELRAEANQAVDRIQAPKAIAQNARPAAEVDVDLMEREISSEKRSIAWNEFLLRWANACLPQDPFRTICGIMVVLMLSTLVKHFLMLASDLLIGHVSTSIVRRLRQRVFDSALAMDRSTYQGYGTSGLLSAITNAADSLAAGLISMFGAAIREPMRVIACLIGAAFISWRLLLLGAVLAPLLIWFVVYFNKRIRSVASSILARNAGFHEVLLEALNNIYTVQAFTMEDHERVRFAGCTNDMRRMSMKMILYNGMSKPFTELVGIGMVAITVCVGAYLVINKQTSLFMIPICNKPMSVTDLMFFFGFLIGASDPLRKLSGVSLSIFNGAISADLLYGILKGKSNVVDPERPIALAKPHLCLELKQVSFHYHPEKKVLKEIDVSIPYGKTIVILGSNGSGKSTLIQLLGRYYDPVVGSIQLDGVDFRDLAIQDIRSRITLVSQNTELFNRSVMENIRYGSPNASEEDAIAAAKMAHAHEFIESALSHGYDTVVGQSGQRLSGGQRQRVALARAILRRPEILILDESTSQIDMASELKIRETLQSMKGQFTIIIITHREALIALADDVYRIESGQLCRESVSAMSAA
jgi:ATP-binding cassette, subfamily B, bacterial MsbA